MRYILFDWRNELFRGRWLLRAGAFVGLVAAILILTVIVQKKGESASAVTATSWPGPATMALSNHGLDPGSPAGDIPAPEFVLHDQQDRLTSLAQFRGKVVMLTFIDPECTQICPLTTQSMVEALKILGPDMASQVQLLGIDANPLKTRVEDVAAYTRAHRLAGRWRFLTGSRAQLESVWRHYHVYVAATDDDIEHDTAVFLLDGNGRERTIYTTPMSYQAVGNQAQSLAAGIARLLPGHSAIPASSQALPQPEGALSPDESVSLTAIGPKATDGGCWGHPSAPVVVFRWMGWAEFGTAEASRRARQLRCPGAAAWLVFPGGS